MKIRISDLLFAPCCWYAMVLDVYCPKIDKYLVCCWNTMVLDGSFASLQCGIILLGGSVLWCWVDFLHHAAGALWCWCALVLVHTVVLDGGLSLVLVRDGATRLRLGGGAPARKLEQPRQNYFEWEYETKNDCTVEQNGKKK